jgi:hypothetical protein
VFKSLTGFTKKYRVKGIAAKEKLTSAHWYYCCEMEVYFVQNFIG